MTVRKISKMEMMLLFYYSSSSNKRPVVIRIGWKINKPLPFWPLEHRSNLSSFTRQQQREDKGGREDIIRLLSYN
jgi:hypothetical protein